MIRKKEQRTHDTKKGAKMTKKLINGTCMIMRDPTQTQSVRLRIRVTHLDMYTIWNCLAQ